VHQDYCLQVSKKITASPSVLWEAPGTALMAKFRLAKETVLVKWIRRDLLSKMIAEEDRHLLLFSSYHNFITFFTVLFCKAISGQDRCRRAAVN
jgi:hypothetical protein